MRIAITGSSGLIGRAVADALKRRGDAVTRVVRRAPAHAGEAGWDPAAGRIDAAALEGHDAVVHLAGESVAGRWTARKKARIRDSRVDGTSLLAHTLARLRRPPATLVSASGAGYYGARPAAATVDESGEAGDDFLARTVVAWEAATRPAAEAGVRVVHLRSGVVLSPAGGALRLMLPAFRLGLGGRLGSGRQPLSWIALPDVVHAVLFLLDDAGAEGPFNLVSPNPTTNGELAAALGRVLRRPVLVPVPGRALRLVVGELADTLLTGARVLPRRLREHGFRFEHPDLEPALRHLLHAAPRHRS